MVSRRAVVGAAAGWIALAWVGAGAQKPFVKGDSTTLTATVEAIDRTDRTVTLKASDGRMITMDVGDAVKRFDALKVGDRVTGTYYENVVLAVEQPGAPPFTFDDSTALTPTPGGKPGGTLARQVKAAGRIEDVQREASSVTVRGDRGRVMSFRIQDPKVLERLKKGDRINVTYTEALLVRIEP
jgi:Cu/Ag efflux protein CusF